MDSPKTNDTDATTLNLSMTNGHRKMSSDDDNDYIPSINDVPEKMVNTKTRKNALASCLGENVLTIATLIAVLVGIGLGFGLKSYRTWSKREVMYVNFLGELFLNMLKCLILPLIVSSLVTAIGNLDTKLTGKIGLRAVVYYMSTTLLAIILGIILVVSIRPGAIGFGESAKEQEHEPRPSLIEDTLMDLIRNMFPPNIFEACLTQYSTVLIPPKNTTENYTENLREWDLKRQMVGQTNILGVVVASIVLGITLGRMNKKGKPLLDIFTSLNEAIMIITRLVIWFSPIGVLSLVASKIMEMDDLAVIAGQVGFYSLTVLAGLFVHGFIVLPLIYFAMVRKNPFSFMIRMGQALATAFGTASSSATLPITLMCLEDKNHIDPRVSLFCVPIGATINMDGTALYEAVAAIFVAQVRGITLTVGNIIAISITATAASIGAAGIPQAGLVTMVMVLNVVGLPAEDVALILVVDWILDRFRTTLNVLGDAYGSGIVAHLSEKDLAELSNLDEINMEMTTL